MKFEPIERMVCYSEILIKYEKPVILPNEKMCENIPDIFTEDEWAEIKSKHYIHELRYLSNLSPNFEDIIKVELLAKYESVNEYVKRCIFIQKLM